MVHVKYTYKDGKRFGPYYYETKRVGGEIKTYYLGSTPPHNPKSFSSELFMFALILLFAVLLLFLIYNKYTTSNVLLDIHNSYQYGELINGSIAFMLDSGELIPADANVHVSYGSMSYTRPLRELLNIEQTNGFFYAKGLDLSGSGNGYGFIGERTVSPTISFEIKLIPTDSTTTPSDSTPSDSSTTPTDSTTTPSDSTPSDSSTTPSESQPPEQSSITGSVISETHSGTLTVPATVSAELPYEYTAPEGYTAELVSGSLTYNGSTLDDSLIHFSLSGRDVSVTTDYIILVSGFGENYVSGEQHELSIPLDTFVFNATEDAELSVSLIYNELIIASKSVSIGVTNEIVNETNETVLENTTNVTNITVNTTQYTAVLGQPVHWVRTIDLSQNDSIQLQLELPESADNVTVTKLDSSGEVTEILTLTEGSLTSEYLATNQVGGSTSDESINAGSATIETTTNNNSSIDSSSENAIITDTSTSSEIQTNEPIEVITVPITGEVISGQVSADIRLNKNLDIKQFFKKLLGITGKVTDEETDSSTNPVALEVNVSASEQTVVVEYYTAAPYAIESEENGLKTVAVVSPTDVHYENVLIYTNLSELNAVSSSSRLRIHWIENDTTLPIYQGIDTDNDGLIDYVSWIAPHLSNQTYQIIVIIGAEHLDENYALISNIYDDVRELDGNWSETIPAGHYVRVTFERNLTSLNDITVYPRTVSGTPQIKIYEYNTTIQVGEISLIVDNSENKALLNTLIGTQDKFDLAILNGDIQFDYIVDPDAPPNITFVTPTPSDKSTQPSTTISVNISTTDPDSARHYVFTEFDKDLMLWMRFDDVNATNGITDLSRYSRNGTLVSATINTTGVFGNKTTIDQVNRGGTEYILINNTNLSQIAWPNGAISFWYNHSNSTLATGETPKNFSRIIANEPSNNAGFSFRFNRIMLENALEATIGNSSATNFGSVKETNGDYSLTFGNWTHYVVTWNNGVNMTLWRNGALIATDITFSGEMGGQGYLRIGATTHSGPTDQNLSFDMDDLMIFNRSLTKGEILALYNATANQYFNNFTGLSNGVHSFTGYTVDSSGNRNQTETRNVTVGSTITNCTIISSPGVYTQGNDINNTVFASYCIFINSSNVRYDGQNYLLANSNVNEDPVIQIQGQNNVTLTNLNVRGLTSTAQSGVGIGLYIISSSNITIANSTISNSISEIYLESGITNANNLFTNLTLFNTPGSNPNGYGAIYVSGTNNTFNSINISDEDGGTISNTIALDNTAHNNTFTNISIYSRRSMGGISIEGESNIFRYIFANLTNSTPSSVLNVIGKGNLFNHVLLIANASSSIVILQNMNVNFTNVTIKNLNKSGLDLSTSDAVINGTSFTDSYFANYSLGAPGGTIEVINSLYGGIKFVRAVNGSGTNLTGNIVILNNSVFVNSTQNRGLNRSANITLFGLSTTINSPEIRKDGVTCGNSCNNFTSLLAGTVKFNVTTWTNYSIDSATAISGCTTISSPGTYTQTKDIHDGSVDGVACILITSSNVTYDGAGYSIIEDLTGQGADDAFYLQNVNNNIINNLKISGNYPNCGGECVHNSLNLNGVNDSQFTNITVAHSTNYITLSNSIRNNFTNITFTGAANEVNTAAGLSLATSSNNTFKGIISTTVPSNVLSVATSNLNNFENISVYTGGTYVGSTAIYNDGNNNFFKYIYANTTSDGTYGYAIQEAGQNNTYQNALFNVNGSDGLRVNDAININYTNVSLININPQFLDIYWSGTNYNGTSFTDSYFANYSLGATGGTIEVINSLYGRVKFVRSVNGSGTNFSRDIFISNNSVFVNSSKNVGLNRSANITLFGLSTTNVNPVIYRDGVACGNSCKNFTSLLAGTVLFNVTTWTNYSVGQGPPTVTVYFPLNDTKYNANQAILKFNVSLSQNGSVQFTVDGGATNYTMLGNEGAGKFGTYFNYTNALMTTATYIFRVYANDTLGNVNYTSSPVTLLYDPAIPALVLTNPTPISEVISTANTTADITVAYFQTDINHYYSFIDIRNSNLLWMPFDYLLADGNVSDLSNYNLNGTLINGAVVNRTGYFGNASHFDGTNDYINITDSGSNLDFNSLRNQSWSMWVNKHTNGTMCVLGKGTRNGGIELCLNSSASNGGKMYAQFCYASSSVKYCSTNFSTNNLTNTWTHFVFVYTAITVAQSNNFKIYADGGLIGQEGASPNLAPDVTSPYFVGAGYALTSSPSPSNYFDGDIDELLMFNYSLSVSEIKNLFKANLTSGAVATQVNVTTLYPGTYTALVYDFDSFANLKLQGFSFTIDSAPFNSTPLVINSTYGTNNSYEDLNGKIVVSGPESQGINVTVYWFNSSRKHYVQDYNHSYSNGTTVVAILGGGNTTKGENWTVGFRLFDGYGYSYLINSTNLTILNSAPNVTLLSPPNNSQFNASTTVLNFTGTDGDIEQNLVQIWGGFGHQIDYERLIYYNRSTFDGSQIKYKLDALPIANTSANLVALYHFDNQSRYGENDTNVFDFGPSRRYNASCRSISECPTWNYTGARFGGAYLFDGVDDILNITSSQGSSSSLSILPVTGGPLSISAWINTRYSNAGSSKNQTIVSRTQDDLGNQFNDYYLGLAYDSEGGQGLKVVFSLADATLEGTITGGINSNQWYHIVATYDKTTANIYVDGVLVYSGEPVISPRAGELTTTIGAKTGKPGGDIFPFNGTIDDVAIYNLDINRDTVSYPYLHNLSNGTYFWVVNATDLSGASNNSNIWQFKLGTDTSAPVVALSGPANITRYSTGSQINFSWSVTDDVDTQLYCNLTIDSIVNATNIETFNLNYYPSYIANQTVTGFSHGLHYWNVSCWDDYGNRGNSQTNTFVINNLPYNSTTIVINSTLGLNRTLENLNVKIILLDQDNDTMNVTVRWFNNSKLAHTFNYNNSYANGTTFIATLGYRNTTKGQNWSAQIFVNDSFAINNDNHLVVNSSNLTILNSPPNVTLLLPTDAFDGETDRTPNFTWAMSDDDGDAIIGSQLNVSLRANSGDSPCTDSNYNGNSIISVSGTNTSYTITTDLHCLADYSWYYDWSVRANDSSTSAGQWATFSYFVYSYVDIKLNVSSVAFGNIAYLGWNDTSDNSPPPLLLENNGTVYVNVSVSSSYLWNSVQTFSNYYMYKFANNTLENGSFLWSQSITNYAQFDSNPDVNLATLTYFNYSDDRDTAELDINISVPPSESPGYRNSTILFTAWLGE